MEKGISTSVFDVRFVKDIVEVPKEVEPTFPQRFGKEISLQGHSQIVHGPFLTGEHLRLIQDVELRNLELGPVFCLKDWTSEKLDYLMKQFAKSQISVCSFHEIIYDNESLGSLDAQHRKYILREDKRQVDSLRMFNPKTMVIHPFNPNSSGNVDKKQIRYFQESLRELAEYCERLNVKVAVENLPFPNHVELVMEMIEPFSDSNVGVCLDTGHCHCVGESVDNALKICGNRLIALHIQDNDGSMDQHLVPFEGTIPWKSFYQSLCDKTNFQGVLIYEPLFKSNLKSLFDKLRDSYVRMTS